MAKVWHPWFTAHDFGCLDHVAHFGLSRKYWTSPSITQGWSDRPVTLCEVRDVGKEGHLLKTFLSGCGHFHFLDSAISSTSRWETERQRERLSSQNSSLNDAGCLKLYNEVSLVKSSSYITVEKIISLRTVLTVVVEIWPWITTINQVRTNFHAIWCFGMEIKLKGTCGVFQRIWNQKTGS